MKLSGLWGRRKGGNEVKVGVVARSISARNIMFGAGGFDVENWQNEMNRADMGAEAFGHSLGHRGERGGNEQQMK